MGYYFAVLLFLFFSCSSSEKVASQTPPEIFANLGDGINVDHFFPIADYLVKLNSTLKQKEDLEKNYKNSMIKGEKAQISRFLSSEFSHLVKAIAQFNKLKAAAVYTKFGLAIGYVDEKNRLPMFYENSLAENYRNLNAIYFKKLDNENYMAIRAIQSAENKENVGFSVVVFDTTNFKIPENLSNN